MVKEYIHYLRYTKMYSENTIRAYYKAIEAFIIAMKPYDKTWRNISEQDIKAYLAFQAHSKKPASIILYVAAIRGIFAFANREYGIANVARYIQSPKKEVKIPHIISIDVIKKAIEIEPNSDFKKAIYLMAFCGCRTSEVLSISAQDIDVVDGRILIHGKGNKERYIFVPTSFAKKLYKDSERIFNYEDRFFRYRVWLIFQRLGVYCSPHMLRHTFASYAISEGMRLDVLRVVLGHSSIATTQIYLDTSSEIVKDEMLEFQSR